VDAHGVSDAFWYVHDVANSDLQSLLMAVDGGGSPGEDDENLVAAVVPFPEPDVACPDLFGATYGPRSGRCCGRGGGQAGAPEMGLGAR
jgi:hypothetical protein